ncbi:MAG: ATP-dependent DNA helicase RecG [Rickettsiales bacterium]|nr:ATP-dependent DNA helicase RecG [Rickettsiales bacterium]
MRDSILNFFFIPLEKIKGIGPKYRDILKNLLQKKTTEVYTKDLFFHLPFRIISRIKNPNLRDDIHNQNVIMKVKVVEGVEVKARNRRVFKIICEYEKRFIDIIYFNGNEKYLSNLYKQGRNLAISGLIENYNNKYQITHPRYVLDENEIDKIPLLEPVYMASEGISSKIIGKIINSNFEHFPELPEWIDANFLKKNNWQSFRKSLFDIHNPKSLSDISLDGKNRQRLAYDELLASQLAISITRKKIQKQKGQALKSENILVQNFLQKLPFELTNGQKNIMQEVFSEMESEFRMFRLVQGDVGSGKTAIAVLAMIKAVEAGFQAGFMAPTEILAKQQFDWLEGIIKNSELENFIKITLLTGSTKEVERKVTLPKIASGEINIVIGTHALFQEKIIFHKLGFIVIDEQHRFGVKQRLSLSEKGEKTDILLMSATPIPRTLAMTIYGDMEISTLAEKPAGRQEIDTRIISNEKIDEVTQGIIRAVSAGSQVYWVCPLVSKNEEELEVVGEDEKVISVEERYEKLQEIFGQKVGFVHGKLRGEEKNKILQEFLKDNIKILVATTVIEVGVNVPNATIMVIENAEKYGLAQLHQLRGRVGRGEKKSTCILVYGKKTSKIAKDRLNILRQTNDGFKIAEEDMVLRGTGDILGLKQSGFPEFEFADLPAQKDLLFSARDDAKIILEMDSSLTSERGKALRNLLYLFEYDNHIKFLEA